MQPRIVKTFNIQSDDTEVMNKIMKFIHGLSDEEKLQLNVTENNDYSWQPTKLSIPKQLLKD